MTTKKTDLRRQSVRSYLPAICTSVYENDEAAVWIFFSFIVLQLWLLIRRMNRHRTDWYFKIDGPGQGGGEGTPGCFPKSTLFFFLSKRLVGDTNVELVDG